MATLADIPWISLVVFYCCADLSTKKLIYELRLSLYRKLDPCTQHFLELEDMAFSDHIWRLNVS